MQLPMSKENKQCTTVVILVKPNSLFGETKKYSYNVEVKHWQTRAANLLDNCRLNLK